jgi:hypothetical protein
MNSGFEHLCLALFSSHILGVAFRYSFSSLFSLKIVFLRRVGLVTLVRKWVLLLTRQSL